MVQVRLFPKGTKPEEEVLYDLDFEVVPSVGDTICLEFGEPETSYVVVSRRFYVAFSLKGEQVDKTMIALEVSEVKPTQAMMFLKSKNR